MFETQTSLGWSIIEVALDRCAGLQDSYVLVLAPQENGIQKADMGSFVLQCNVCVLRM